MDELIGIEVETTFDAAHRLMKHGGKCWNLHGHTYRVMVEVYGSTLDPVQGMLLDFGDVKATLKMVVEQFDHALLLHADDPIFGVLKDVEPDLKIRVMDQHPTAEVIARTIRRSLERIIERGEREITVRRVKVWETPTSCAIA